MNETLATRRYPAGFPGWVKRFEAALNRVLAVVTVSLLLLSVMLAALGVLMRYAVGISYDLIEEICRISVVYASLLYFGPLITRNAHLTMSFVTDQLSPRALRMFDLFLYCAVTILLAWLVLAAWRWEVSIWNIGMQTMSGAMAAWIPSAALPIGLAIALIYSVFRVIYRIAGIDVESTGEAE